MVHTSTRVLTVTRSNCYDYNMNEGDRAKLRKYLPEALDKMSEAIHSPNERIAVGAARFVIEQCIGKAPQFMDEETKAKGAAELAAALQDALAAGREQTAIEAPIIDGTVRILGAVPEDDESAGLSQQALDELDDL